MSSEFIPYDSLGHLKASPHSQCKKYVLEAYVFLLLWVQQRIHSVLSHVIKLGRHWYKMSYTCHSITNFTTFKWVKNGITQIKSMGMCKNDVTPLLKHWGYVFLALTHRNHERGGVGDGAGTWVTIFTMNSAWTWVTESNFHTTYYAWKLAIVGTTRIHYNQLLSSLFFLILSNWLHWSQLGVIQGKMNWLLVFPW